MDYFFIILIIAIIFLVILFFLYLLKLRKDKLTLFDSGSPLSLKMLKKKLNPPIIKEENIDKFFNVVNKNLDVNNKYLIDTESNQKKEKMKKSKNQPLENNIEEQKKERVQETPKNEIIPENKEEPKKEQAAETMDTAKKEESLQKDNWAKKQEDNNKLNENEQNKKLPPQYIKITNFKQLIDSLNDNDLKDILNYLEDLKLDFIDNEIITKNFLSIKDLIEFIKNELSNYLKDKYNNLKSDISDLRKKGKDMTDLSLKLLSIPLKIKIFESSFSRKDFSNCLDLMMKIEQEIKAIKETILQK